MAPKRPAPVDPRRSRAKLPLEQLIDECRERVPGFAYNLFGFPGMRNVSFQWRYNQFPGVPLWEWQRVRPDEAVMATSFPDVKAAFAFVLERCDRFDAWTKDQEDQRAKAKARAELDKRIMARAAHLVKPPKDVDEGDEEGPAVELDEIKPLPPTLAEASSSDDRPAD